MMYYFFIFGAGLLAGLIDSIAGGGGLLALPTLLSLGLPPINALATNKCAGIAATFSATVNYHRHGLIDWSKMKMPVIMTFLGASLGTWSITHMRPAYLQTIIVFFLIAFGIYFLFSKRLADEERPARISLGVLSFSVIPLIGFYDGFFGPGTGAFFMMAFVVFLGWKARVATAHTKLLNFSSNVASLSFYIWAGHVVFKVGLVMALGQFLGAYIGSKLVVAKGVGLIRPALVLVSISMAVKLIFWP